MADDVYPAATMSEAELYALAKEIGPVVVDRAGYIWMRSAKGGQTVLANVRGWGYLTGQGSGALGLSEADAMAAQRRWGELIMRAINRLIVEGPDTKQDAGGS